MSGKRKKQLVVLMVSIAGAITIAAMTTGIFLFMSRKEQKDNTLRRAGELLKDIKGRQSGEKTGKEKHQKFTLPSKVLRKGEAGRVGDLIVKVEDWDFSEGKDFQTPATGNVFLVVFVDVKNVGDEASKVSSALQMSAVTDEFYEHNIAVYFPDPRFRDGEILPGKSVSGKVAFEIPQKAESIHFVFNYGGGKVIAVRIK